MNKRAIKHLVEYGLIRIFAALCASLPVDTASCMGGWIARKIGPKTGIHRTARAQIRMIFPDITDTDIDHHITDMWDNLGRTMAEYPHLKKISETRVTIDDPAGVLSNPDLHARPAIFIAGHFANWEICGPALYTKTGIALNLVYRPANNTRVDSLMTRLRSLNGILPTLAKSRGGMRAILDGLSANQKIGLLIDQKYTEGINVDFFGVQASATTIYAQLGHRFHAPVYPVQVVRDHGARFRIIIHPALAIAAPDGTPRPLPDVVNNAHEMMFDWVRTHPGQWLWVHQRWKKDIIQRG